MPAHRIPRAHPQGARPGSGRDYGKARMRCQATTGGRGPRAPYAVAVDGGPGRAGTGAERARRRRHFFAKPGVPGGGGPRGRSADPIVPSQCPRSRTVAPKSPQGGSAVDQAARPDQPPAAWSLVFDLCRTAALTSATSLLAVHAPSSSRAAPLSGAAVALPAPPSGFCEPEAQWCRPRPERDPKSRIPMGRSVGSVDT